MPQPKTLEDKYRELLNQSSTLITALRNLESCPNWGSYLRSKRDSMKEIERIMKRDLGNQGQNKKSASLASHSSGFGNSNQQIKIQL